MLVIEFDEACREAGRRSVGSIEEMADVMANATGLTWIEGLGFACTAEALRVLGKVGRLIKEMAHRAEEGAGVCANRLEPANGRSKRQRGRRYGDARIVPERGRSWRRR